MRTLKTHWQGPISGLSYKQADKQNTENIYNEPTVTGLNGRAMQHKD